MSAWKSLFAILVLWCASACVQGQKITYVYTDPQGTPLAEADEQGNITKTFDYRPHGVQALGDPPQGVGYTGHLNDPETDLVYMQARYYDPLASRFLSVDPASLLGGSVFDFNRYSYANNNPPKFVDPDGRKVRFAEGASDQFKNEFALAIKYLNKKGAAESFAKLEKISQVVFIESPESKSNIMHYNSDIKTIVWDPRSALETTDGGKQTPALGLGHEAEHALGDLTGTAASTEKIPGDPYNTAEERRVIDNYETPAAKKLGEGARSDHLGRAYQVKCSTCIEEIK